MADQLKSSEGNDEGTFQSIWGQVRDFFSGRRQKVRDAERARFGDDERMGGGGWGGAGGAGASPWGGNSRFGGWGYGGGGGQQQQQETARELHRRYVDYENMDDYTDASVAVDTYADEATQPDFLRGERLWFEGGNDNVVSDLNFLVQEQLNAERWIWPLTRTTAKYGNDYERMIVGPDGVLEVEALPAALTRRVNDDLGQLAGFIVSPDGNDFGANLQRFNQVTQQRGDAPDRRSIKSYVDDNRTVGFEHWEVSHFRMVGKNRLQEYGWGVLEPARWAWRRLVMMEDAALLHKLCLHGDTRVWTPDGVEEIRDLEEGDEVYSFGHDGKLHRTEVTYFSHNGTDEIYEVESRHRTIRANATHPVLCWVEGNDPHEFEYVEVQDIEPGTHHLVTPERPDDDYENVGVGEPTWGLHEPVRSVEPVGRDDIYDIGVDHECHNFVADGAVVHNTKAPARYAFYVDVGNTSFKKSMNYVQRMRKFYGREPAVDLSGGQIDVDYDPTAMHEDFYIPVNQQRGEAVRVESLSGASYQGMEDVKHFEQKLSRGVKVPNVGDDYQARSEPLTSSDIRFANAVMRLQKAVIEGFKKIADVHLIATGRNPADFRFEGRMAVPSAIMELARTEVLSAKADIVSRLKEHVSVRWMLTNLFGFSEEEAVTLMVQREEERDMQKAAEIEREMERERITNLMREAEGFPDDADVIEESANRAASSGPRYGEGSIGEAAYEAGGGPDVDRFESMVRENHEDLANRLDNLESVLRDIKSHSRFREQAARVGNQR